MQGIDSLKLAAKKSPEWSSLLNQIPANNKFHFFTAALNQIENDALNQLKVKFDQDKAPGLDDFDKL